MFTPSHFKITDHAEIYSFIDLNGFGQIISTVQGKILSTHLPFMLSDDKHTLLGHFAKLNPQCNDIHNQEVLVTLQGPMNKYLPLGTFLPEYPHGTTKQSIFPASARFCLIRRRSKPS